MRLTKSQRKKLCRVKRIRRDTNIRKSLSLKRYYLNVTEKDGNVKYEVKTWKTVGRVRLYLKELESFRRKGNEVLPSVIVDRKSGEVVFKVSGSVSKGSLPDKVLNGVMASIK